MPPTGFTVTYSVITDASAEVGDYAENGFLTCEGDHVPIEDYIGSPAHIRKTRFPIEMTLREAVSMFIDHLEGRIEPDCFPTKYPSWFTLYNEEWSLAEPRDKENRSLHIPEWVSQGSRMRIARLLGVKLS